MKIVYCYLVADLFHIGHLKHLKRAKKEGDYVIAGILTDKATQEKKDKPLISYKERVTIIQAIKYVDKVIPQITYSPIPNILKIKPDIVMESTSHNKEDVKKIIEIVENYGGKVIVNPYYIQQSSSKIKRKIKNEYRT